MTSLYTKTVYSIQSKYNQYQIQQIPQESFFTLEQTCRKAYKKDIPQHSEQIFKDSEFWIEIQEFNNQNKNGKYHQKRIYEFYNNQFLIFSQDYCKDTYLEIDNQDGDLPSFLSEFSMIDKQYIQTRFFTKQINKQGFYQYFIRRNGEYYIDFIDDIIPVLGKKQKPIWGLSINQPWKLILMKAWLKEKKGFRGVLDAQPFQFIDAFGFPGYRVLSIKKQVNFLKASKISEQAKVQKQKKIKLNTPGFITVGKTRDNEKVVELGLKRNKAGYKIIPIQMQNQSRINNLSASSIYNHQNIFKIHSDLPVCWVGQFSVVSGKIRQSYNPHIHKLNIQREFLATYDQISNIFSKFYIAPEFSKYQQKVIIEDSINLPIEEQCPFYLFNLKIQQKGFLNLNIDLPSDSGVQAQGNYRYSPIKYFLSRKKDGQNPQLQDYQFYDGEYVKGYHKSLNRFLQIVEGEYVIYVKIDNRKQNKAKSFAINILTNAKVTKFDSIQQQTSENIQKIIKSTFYLFTKQSGIRCYVHKQVKDLLVYICNKFDQLGFGFVALYVHPKAKGQLAMNANRAILNENKIDICNEAHGIYGDDVPGNFKLIGKPGWPQIIVLEKTVRMRSKTEQFPPEGSIDFYEIY